MNLKIDLPISSLAGRYVRSGSLTLLILVFASSSLTVAQTTYNWQGFSGSQGQTWTATESPITRWDQLQSPGSLLNGTSATDDIVNITNTLASGAQETVWIQGIDVGSVGRLVIGGSAGNGGGDRAHVQVRGGSGNITIDTLQLGTGGGDSNPGRLLVNNSGSSATVNTIVSGSTDTDNRILIGNNASGGLTLNGDIDVSGTREIDIFLVNTTNDSRFVQATGNQLLSVDTFRVGSAFNNENDATYTFSGNTIEANVLQVAQAGGSITSTNVVSSTSVFDVVNATVSVMELNASGEPIGDIQVGRADGNRPEGSTADGTLNLGAGATVIGLDQLLLAQASVGANTTAPSDGTSNPAFSSAGEVNLNDATAVLTIGRIGASNTMDGGIIAGHIRAGAGAINVNDGTLNSFNILYLGGDSNQGTDRNTRGELNVSGGTVNVGADPNFTANGGSAGLNGEVLFDGTARDASVAIGGANLEVGRDGTGALTQTGGTINIFRGNLVLGQDGDDNEPVPDPSDPNAPILGTLTGLAAFDWKNEKAELLFDIDPAAGDIQPHSTNAGEFELTAQGLAKVHDNISRGTVTISGGTFNLGAVQGATINNNNGDPAAELLSNLNYNSGGGDVTVTGTGVLNIENSVNMGGVGATNARNSLTVSGSGVVRVGSGNTGNLNGQASDIAIGAGSDVDIANNFALDADSILTFDFESSMVSDFSLDVGNNATLGDADLNLANSAAVLATFAGDILLIDVTGTTSGVFGNAPAGTVFGSYELVYDYDPVTGASGGGQSVALVQGVTGPLACDFDSDGDCDQADIDLLYATSPSGLDIADWLTQASSPANPFNATAATFVPGDVDLDGDVDSTDLGVLLNNFNDTSGVTWDGGDLNADSVVDSTDLGQLLNNFSFTSAAASAVPEPSALALMLISCLGVLGLVRRR